MEMYFFINPLHADYWTINPIIEKLQSQYGDQLKMTPVWTGGAEFVSNESQYISVQPFSYVLEQVTTPTDKLDWLKQPVFLPPLALLAVKAAQFQGKKAAERLIHQLQIAHFFEKKNMKDENVLKECAMKARLDVDEFTSDIHSEMAINALQDDVKLANEFQVTDIPVFVFFSDDPNEEGVKVSAQYDYHVYENIVENGIRSVDKPTTPLPSLEGFLKEKVLVSTDTLAFLYEENTRKIEIEMKKLVLQQKVEQMITPVATLWKAKSASFETRTAV